MSIVPGCGRPHHGSSRHCRPGFIAAPRHRASVAMLDSMMLQRTHHKLSYSSATRPATGLPSTRFGSARACARRTAAAAQADDNATIEQRKAYYALAESCGVKTTLEMRPGAFQNGLFTTAAVTKGQVHHHLHGRASMRGGISSDVDACVLHASPSMTRPRIRWHESEACS
eukprot:358996-Chlamydomonas_euryale.AAC.8